MATTLSVPIVGIAINLRDEIARKALMAKELTFTTEQLVAVQKTLRQALHLSPEHFSLQAFVGMISDEIEQLRSRGMSDEQIAALVVKATAIPVSGEMIRLYYAPRETRQH